MKKIILHGNPGQIVYRHLVDVPSKLIHVLAIKCTLKTIHIGNVIVYNNYVYSNEHVVFPGIYVSIEIVNEAFQDRSSLELSFDEITL